MTRTWPGMVAARSKAPPSAVFWGALAHTHTLQSSPASEPQQLRGLNIERSVFGESVRPCVRPLPSSPRSSSTPCSDAVVFALAELLLSGGGRGGGTPFWTRMRAAQAPYGSSLWHLQCQLERAAARSPGPPPTPWLPYKALVLLRYLKSETVRGTLFCAVCLPRGCSCVRVL